MERRRTHQLREEEAKIREAGDGENRWLRLLQGIDLFGETIGRSPPPPSPTLEAVSAVSRLSTFEFF